MTRKRKRLKKLFMAAGFDRDSAEWMSSPGWVFPPSSYAFRIRQISLIFGVGKEARR